jgi:glycosyltransferase involved in cell wall biosynthesis
MSFTDLLTIAMPCYERKDFFREALDSALNQTVKCKIIVLDNCSSHNYYEEVCKEKGVTYHRNDSNIGMIGNFSKSFELADTKYVMNLQDDDKLHPEYVESFLNAVTRYPDIDIFFTDLEVNTDHGIHTHPHTLPFGYMERGAKIIEYAIKYKMGFPYIASAIKKSKIHSVKEVSDMIGSWDWEWIYSRANKLSFYGDPRKLYQFRVHDNQITKLEASNHRFSLPYIYDRVLKENVSDIKLKKKASKNASWELFVIKSVVDEKKITEFKNGNNKYSNYLKDKLNENILLKTVFLLPKGLVMFIYKVIRKVEMQFANI